ELDSLSDFISFGVAPAAVLYLWTMAQLQSIGWAIVLFFAVCCALRLARFNTQIGTADKRYFQGLPSPAAAAILAGYVWVGQEYAFQGTGVAMVSALLSVLTGLLMVSNIRYHSFKEIDLRGKVPFFVAIAVMLGFAVVFVHPQLTLFLIFLSYAVSGPALTLITLRRRRLGRKT
ncbi:MAG TPA: CDP-diacylglycerol--serine O-phosphatidyltransferase, partial [Methylococcaceae bacterium]|nr:CDP-diacylglycerol--serine O-phosphatidyltransferase [Methylococcaceae bacterium]